MPRSKDVPRGEDRSGLVLAEDAADLADTNICFCCELGEMGTFHKLASSGRSSSESLHSSSSSLTVFRVICPDGLLVVDLRAEVRLGRSSGVLLDSGCGGIIRVWTCVGDGERDLDRFCMAVIANDGVDGLLNPRLGGFGKLRE